MHGPIYRVTNPDKKARRDDQGKILIGITMFPILTVLIVHAAGAAGIIGCLYGWIWKAGSKYQGTSGDIRTALFRNSIKKAKDGCKRPAASR